MGRVWVIGSLNVDRPWRVERHPVVGETVMGQMLAPQPGGKGLNQAVASRRVGGDVALVGCVGADPDGDWLLEIASAEGIDVSNVSRSEDEPTGSALIVIDEQGANTVTVAPGANAVSTLEDLPVSPGDVVVLQLEIAESTVAAALDLAEAHSARSILNPSPSGPGSVLARRAHVVVVNEHEAADLVGSAEPAGTADEAMAHARSIRSEGQLVVVTLGAGGIVAAGPDGEVTEPGIESSAIDTTGAGDCFLGVFAAGLAAGQPVARAIERANTAAAHSVRHLGTVPSMPTAADLGWSTGR